MFEREFADVRPLSPGPTRIPLAPAAGSHGGPGKLPMAPRAAIAIDRDGGQVTGAAGGVSHELLRTLGRGDTPIEATCDLHGMRAEAARARLRGFIEVSVERGRRVVLVVCGRGLHSGPTGPVLLEMTIETLGQSQHVLAFTSAAAKHGGEGALMVQLRGKRRS
jgi:DNA-nicking Smr family endonuclease